MGAHTERYLILPLTWRTKSFMEALLGGCMPPLLQSLRVEDTTAEAEEVLPERNRKRRFHFLNKRNLPQLTFYIFDSQLRTCI